MYIYIPLSRADGVSCVEQRFCLFESMFLVLVRMHSAQNAARNSMLTMVVHEIAILYFGGGSIYMYIYGMCFFFVFLNLC